MGVRFDVLGAGKGVEGRGVDFNWKFGGCCGVM